jgi:hypothetical protein
VRADASSRRHSLRHFTCQNPIRKKENSECADVMRKRAICIEMVYHIATEVRTQHISFHCYSGFS